MLPLVCLEGLHAATSRPASQGSANSAVWGGSGAACSSLLKCHIAHVGYLSLLHVRCARDRACAALHCTQQTPGRRQPNKPAARALPAAAPELLGVSAAQMKEFEDNGEHNRISHAMQVGSLSRRSFSVAGRRSYVGWDMGGRLGCGGAQGTGASWGTATSCTSCRRGTRAASLAGRRVVHESEEALAARRL
jgi:hypothetical protein